MQRIRQRAIARLCRTAFVASTEIVVRDQRVVLHGVQLLQVRCTVIVRISGDHRHFHQLCPQCLHDGKQQLTLEARAVRLRFGNEL